VNLRLDGRWFTCWQDFRMEARDRLRAGIIEWLVAVKGG
jgi:hypothetical protein